MRALKIILRTVSHILSVILCFVLMATVLATMLASDLRVFTSDSNWANTLVNEILFAPPSYTVGPVIGATTVGPELDLGAILSGEGDLTDILIEYAAGMLGDTEAEISKEDIEAFVEESTLKEFISEKASTIVSDILTGSNETTISGEEIKELLEENKDLIEEHFDVVITEEQIDSIVTQIEEMPEVQEIQKNGIASFLTGGMTAPDGSDESYDDSSSAPSNSMSELQQILETVRLVSSDAVFFACLGACAFLIALLFLLAWNKPYIAMLYSGSTIFTTGLIFLIPTLIATYAPATWMGLFSNIPDMGAMIGGVSRIVLMLTGSVCGIVTGFGLVLFVGGIVVFSVMKKAKKAKAAKAALTEEAPVSPFAAAAAEVFEAAEAAPVAEAPTAEETPAAEETTAGETV